MFTEWNTEQKAKLLTTVPCYLDALLSHDFGVVRGSRLLIQTDMITSLYVTLSYNLFWLKIDNGYVYKVECLDKTESQSLFYTYYYRFPKHLIQKVYACFIVGTTVRSAFQAYKGNRLPPPKVTLCFVGDGIEERIYTLRNAFPFRAAFLQLEVDSGECIVSMHFWVGEAAHSFIKMQWDKKRVHSSLK